MALSFCGDGENLSSGYTFLIGADGNSHSMLLKGTQIVADSNADAALLPRMTDSDLLEDLTQEHQHWWSAKINKIGPRVECWLDNKLLFTYDDSKPLDVGQIALWTYNNGIVLSRVQIFYENELSAPALKTPRAK